MTIYSSRVVIPCKLGLNMSITSEATLLNVDIFAFIEKAVHNLGENFALVVIISVIFHIALSSVLSWMKMVLTFFVLRFDAVAQCSLRFDFILFFRSLH